MNMKEKVHLWAARFYFAIAEEKDREYQPEKDQNKRIALRVVAAQNYFYAAVNAIEAAFAKKGEHSFNHENRLGKIYENRLFFDEEIVQLYQKVERARGIK